MAQHDPADPDFWTSGPEQMRESVEMCEAVGLKVRHFILGNPDDEHTPTAAVLKMPPGFVLARHAHTCERLEVILEGSLEVEGEVHGPGHIMQTGARQFYGPHIAGPGGCTTMEIFSSIRGNGPLGHIPDDASGNG